MATCMKRTSKLFDPSLWRSPSHANLRDLLCPVCRGILIEPVTLPCEHNLCLGCLNGTIEHNNLNCPLCRTRVGSWLRTNSKSLVNIRLWEIIRTKFPKEVEGRRNGDEADIHLDSGYTARAKVLSAAGEIRKEYEAQLQQVEEEKRRKQQAEAIASEALIRKIQAEEQQHLAQLAQDELYAKTLAKKEISNKIDPKMKTEPMSKSMQKSKTQSSFDCDASMMTKYKTSTNSQKTNIALISKIRAESYASSMKDSSEKVGSYKALPVQDAVTRLLKNQVVTKFVQPNSSTFTLEPSCSKIYGMQSKEELHVPNDVLNSKKGIGVEISVTTVTDDPRIGSAESAGSHDSINQEIHHFKPIRAMPRTTLKITPDGRQIDPKLLRVTFIYPKKLTQNLSSISKPPTPSRFKKIPSCSWSAFRGKKQDSRSRKLTAKVEEPESETKPLLAASQMVVISGTLVKPHVSEKSVLSPEMSLDSNKNINRIINGTKVSKKLNLEESSNIEKAKKPWRSQVKNGTLEIKPQKNACNLAKAYDSDHDLNNTDSQSINSSKSDLSIVSQKEELSEESAVENIAERIKKRKINVEKPRFNNNTDDFVRRSLRKRSTAVKYNTGSSETLDEISEAEEELPKRKRGRKTAPKLEKEKDVIENSPSKIRSQPPELTREAPISKKRRGKKKVLKFQEEKSSDDEASEVPEKRREVEDAVNTSDDAIISDQKRIEEALLQEQADRELAERLQAQFNEWENMVGRTRNSRRALETGNLDPDVLNLGLGRRTRRNGNSNNTTGLSERSSRSQRKRPEPLKLDGFTIDKY